MIDDKYLLINCNEDYKRWIGAPMRKVNTYQCNILKYKQRKLNTSRLCENFFVFD